MACTSLHHVEDVGHVLDRVVAAVAPGGVLVVVGEISVTGIRHTARRGAFSVG